MFRFQSTTSHCEYFFRAPQKLTYCLGPTYLLYSVCLVRLLVICRPTVAFGVVVVVGVCNRSQMRTSKCPCLIFGVSIGLDHDQKCAKGIFDRSKFKVTRDMSPHICCVLSCQIIVLGQYISKWEKLSFIVKTPRETTFLLDIPISSPLMPYSLASLHDVSPLKIYSNYTQQLDMQQLLLPEFDSYKTFSNKFTPSFTGTPTTLLLILYGQQGQGQG